MSRFFVVVGLLWGTTFASAADWPQWLGPKRDGSSTEVVPAWQGELKADWSIDVAEGNSSPVVADGKLFIHAIGKDIDEEMMSAYDAATGKLLWQQKYAKTKFKPLFGVGPRATPVVDGELVFSLGNTGTLVCYSAATGKIVWQAETLATPSKDNLLFGVSASPIVVGDLVVVQTGQKGSVGTVAYNKKTGKKAWTAGKDASSYAAPIWINNQIVMLSGAHLQGINTKGEIVWKVPFRDLLNESSTTPVYAGGLYIASSVTAGAVGVQVTGSGDKMEAKQVWKNNKLTCYFSTPVAVDDKHMYMATGVASLTKPSIMLRCVEIATGKEIWNKPDIGKYHAALLKMGDGKLLMHDDQGNLMLLAPNVTKYEELARTKACGPTWAHPAVANGKIYVRDESTLKCISIPK